MIRALPLKGISIHAPRTGSDITGIVNVTYGLYFNPRSPHGERLLLQARVQAYTYFNPRSPHGERQKVIPFAQVDADFNPRSPHGERPPASRFQSYRSAYFNPRSPHGERRSTRRSTPSRRIISIHAPRTGSDTKMADVPLAIQISIHAPRTGSDCPARCPPDSGWYFNPRSPHGERRRSAIQ